MVVAKLADAMLIEKAKPQPDWQEFSRRAFGEQEQADGHVNGPHNQTAIVRF
jgi:hypothetical protein